MAETDSSANTFVIASASRAETLNTVMLSGIFSGSSGTVSVTTIPLIPDLPSSASASSEKSAWVTKT